MGIGKRIAKEVGMAFTFGVQAFFLGCFLAFFAVLIVLAAGALFSMFGA